MKAWYRNYMLCVLLVISAFNYVDRIALGLVLQDIKAEFSLSDTELGVLTGIAFALFYSLMGIPIARWADRGNRVRIISITTGLWSVALAACAMVGSFLQLLLIRVGAAVGEAGCLPPAHSLIADYFSRAERPRAVAIYMLGAPLSLVLGYFAAGWLNQLFGWRMMFLLLGVPGVFLALLVALTVREPRRSGLSKSNRVTQDSHLQAENAVHLPLCDVVRVLWRNTTFRYLLISFSITCFFAQGIAQWSPTFFVRSFGLATGELGTWLAIVYGVGGVAGLIWGGEIATRLAPNDEEKQLKAIALAFAAFGFLTAIVYSSPNYYIAFIFLAISSFGSSLTTGPLFATIQTLIPGHMRATSIAILYLFANLIGMGLGPLITGALSDAFQPLAGNNSLRYSLLALCPGYIWGAWYIWRASNTVARDILKANAESVSETV